MCQSEMELEIIAFEHTSGIPTKVSAVLENNHCVKFSLEKRNFHEVVYAPFLALYE